MKFNGKKQRLLVSIVEVNFSETTIHFKPLDCTRKLKEVTMQNDMLVAQFPNQKNMVQVNYKGEMFSMLFSAMKTFNSISIDDKK